MSRHKVKPGEWLSSIALQYDYHDKGDAIWNANPDVYLEGKPLGKLQKVTAGNRDALLPGWEFEIQDKKQKQEGKPSDQAHKHSISPAKKNLAITLCDTEGNPVGDTWHYRFDQADKEPQKGDTAGGKILAKEIDETIPEAVLAVFESKAFGLWKFPPERIRLHIGGLDPVVEGVPGKKALQKILKNLGYYSGTEDGLYGPKTRAALLAFQHDQQLPESGYADDPTCQHLIQAQKNALPQSKPLEQAPTKPAPVANATGSASSPSKNLVRWRPKQPLSAGGPIELLDDWAKTYVKPVFIKQLKGMAIDLGRKNGKAVIGQFSGRVQFHVDGGDKLQAAWAEIEAEGLLDRVKTWDGAFVPRFQRGSVTKLSNHSFATAFDINAEWNRLGHTPAAIGDEGSVMELVPIFERHGFKWGGNFGHGRTDGMHFELNDMNIQNVRVDAAQPSASGPATKQSQGNQHNLPLESAGAIADTLTEKTTTFSGYLDPTTPTQNEKLDRVTLGKFQFFPHEAFVAPCDVGEESKNPNVIRMPARKFVFLDSGRWLKDHHDFGLIWGRHVYLCEFVPEGGAGVPKFDRPDGLDVEFFTALGDKIRVVKRTSAVWAPDSDFNWEKIFLVIPDLHLMDGEIGEYWKPGFYEGDRALQSEIDLLQFAHVLVGAASLKSRLQVIQIGDSYDLWVGDQEYGITEPLYAKDEENRVMHLKDPADASRLAGWVQRIQGLDEVWVLASLISRDDYAAILGKYGHEMAVTTERNHWHLLNPAEAAMRLIEKTFGMVYIWGNHDNYLACSEVCSAAGLTQRQRWLEAPGLLIEHGHRLEATFNLPFSANYDGCYAGYKLTQGAYADAKGGSVRRAIAAGKVWVADKYAAAHDQREYRGEFAQVWLGRQSNGQLKPPHIFVIGHTHMPNLWTVNIDAYRF